MKPKDLQGKLTISFLGRSGCGKGTQAKFILKRLNHGAYHLETGRFLRQVLRKSNPTTRIARRLMEEGRLFPSWFGAFTWLKELIEKGHADKDLVFDGAPRKVQEAELIDEVLEWHKRPLPLCVYVDVPQKEAMRRLLARGRDDDHPSAIRHRMEYFSKKVLPVIHYYRKHHRLVRVNGARSIL